MSLGRLSTMCLMRSRLPTPLAGVSGSCRQDRLRATRGFHLAYTRCLRVRPYGLQHREGTRGGDQADGPTVAQRAGKAGRGGWGNRCGSPLQIGSTRAGDPRCRGGYRYRTDSAGKPRSRGSKARSEAPLPYISAVSTRVTPSAMLARKAPPTSLRLYSLPYPQSLVVPHAQTPTPRGAMFSSSARPSVSSLCKATPLIPSPLYPRTARTPKSNHWMVRGGLRGDPRSLLGPRTGPAGGRTRAGSYSPSAPPRRAPPIAVPGTA